MNLHIPDQEVSSNDMHCSSQKSLEVSSLSQAQSLHLLFGLKSYTETTNMRYSCFSKFPHLDHEFDQCQIIELFLEEESNIYFFELDLAESLLLDG